MNLGGADWLEWRPARPARELFAPAAFPILSPSHPLASVAILFVCLLVHAVAPDVAMATVNQNMFATSIPINHPGGASLMVLPLNLIAQIVSNVEDTGDLARLCRTCRVLNYMALPQLYRSLTLTSYGKIRYRDERPEGVGSASPFTMGLNAVITRPYATIVQSITLRGERREDDLEEHAQVGRVPDSSMLLNIAVRAAVDRMTNLESFSWELNTKMLDVVYSGLTQLPRLTSLTIRFPSTRHPQPTFVLPGMPHLRSLKITDIDPLCYPDDIATMLWKSKKLRDLRLHWSPRMRIAQEPSVSLHEYFRKCASAKQPLSIQKLSFQNLYAFHSEDFDTAFDPSTVEDITFLSGTDTTGLINTFVDNSWPTTIPHTKLKIKSIRMDVLSKRNSEFLSSFRGLERIYLVNVTTESSDYLNSPQPGPGPASSALTPPVTDSPANGLSNSPATPANPQLNVALSVRDSYLSNIINNHGATLRHLLLCSKWPLSTNMVARLVHSCPNLEQLAIATEFSSMDSLGMLVPFLRKLVALRLLIPAGSPASQTGPNHDVSRCSVPTSNPPFKFSKKFSIADTSVGFSKKVEEVIENARSLVDVVDLDDELLMEMMSYDLADKQVFGNVKIIGMGWKAFELRDFYKASPLPAEESESRQSPLTFDHPSEPADDNASSIMSPAKGTGTVSGTPEQSASASQSKSPAAPSYTNNMGSTASSTTPAANPPPSALGKRTRDDDDDVAGRHSSISWSGESYGYRDGASHGCRLPPILTDDGQILKRRMRRVGWEVLQHWEIWGLDAQEI
ncbi:uncharacterized protein N7459_003258 [Penicillium hispanicum]|uniref:uncharacterized protein n=1 Tax=Penicillium hispanicum TaxID=1080232 RepID=UPI002541A4A4|nr:uncharacterized protein N7459_003258 [Penicillium hispanicum]KAJ5587493.1 hypothetical protein N7459_003258 [Penicillium hispanicum]